MLRRLGDSVKRSLLVVCVLATAACEPTLYVFPSDVSDTPASTCGWCSTPPPKGQEDASMTILVEDLASGADLFSTMLRGVALTYDDTSDCMVAFLPYDAMVLSLVFTTYEDRDTRDAYCDDFQVGTAYDPRIPEGTWAVLSTQPVAVLQGMPSQWLGLTLDGCTSSGGDRVSAEVHLLEDGGTFDATYQAIVDGSGPREGQRLTVVANTHANF